MGTDDHFEHWRRQVPEWLMGALAAVGTSGVTVRRDGDTIVVDEGAFYRFDEFPIEQAASDQQALIGLDYGALDQLQSDLAECSGEPWPWRSDAPRGPGLPEPDVRIEDGVLHAAYGSAEQIVRLPSLPLNPTPRSADGID